MRPPDLQIEKQPVAGTGITVVTLKGQLDAHTFSMLETVMDQIFEDGCFKIVFKLDALDYVASAGMGVFISTLARAEQQQGGVVLVNLAPKVRNVFEMFGLLDAFRSANDTTAAIAML